MFKQKILHRIFLAFLIFALIFIIPFSLTVHKELKKMVEKEEKAETPEEKERIHSEFQTQFRDSIVVFSFYTFVFAFFLSLFFSRSLLKPIRDFFEGAKSIKEGNLDVRLEVINEDELGEVTRSFNEMAASLQKKTEELKRKELYVSTMMDPLWVLSDNNVITDVNPASAKLFGYSRDFMIGTSVFDVVDGENSKILKSNLNFEGKSSSSIFEISIIAKNGSLIPVLITCSPILKDDQVTDKICILKDFRREHQLRDALRESRDSLESIMDSIEDDLLVIDREFKIVRANKAVKAKKGEGVIGNYCYSTLHDLSMPCWQAESDCPSKKVFETGRISKTVHRHASIAGNISFHDIVSYPITDQKGNVTHAIEFIRDVTEEKEHERKITQRNRELTAINSIADILSRSLNIEEILSGVMGKLIELLRMDGGGIYLMDEANRELICAYHRGISEEFARITRRLRIGEDIPGKVAATGQLITIPDIESDQRIERSILKHAGMKGYCVIPIKGKERIVGVFCIFSFSPHTFAVEEERLLNSIGEMTGIAIENIRLYEEMRNLYKYLRQRREDDHKSILSLSSKLTADLDIKAVMNSSIELIKGAFKADLAWLLEIKDQDLILKAASGLNISRGETIYTKGTSSLEWFTIEKNMPVIIPAFSSENRFHFSDYLMPVYKSAVCIPVHAGEKVIGALTLYYVVSKEIKEDDIHFLQIVSSILAVALERSETYEKTLLEREMSDTILQSISDGILTVDTKCRIISVNKTISNIIGVNQEQILGKQCCDIFNYSRENNSFRWTLGACLNSALERRSENIEADLITAAGRKISVMISSSPVIDSDGKVVGVVNALRNVTREKEIDRMKTEFVNTVSHQFRTPLSAIIGMTEMIIDGDVKDDKAKEYLTTVLSEGKRLSEMVEDLLNIARIESGREPFREEAIDFNLMLNDLKKLFTNALKKKKGKLTTVINGDIKEFTGDKGKLSQLMKNLISNSIAYSDEGCSINISIAQKDDNLEINVSDNGWGIPEEDIPHLTERFYRGRHGQAVKGTGLGLALCKDIVTLHGGNISFKSTPDQGTTVTLNFPYRRKA